MDIEQTVAGITNTSDLMNTINPLEASSTSTNDKGTSDIMDDTGKDCFVELIIKLFASKPHIFESKVYESSSLPIKKGVLQLVLRDTLPQTT